MRAISLPVLLLLASIPAQAKLNVLTTTSDLAALAREVAGEAANVESLARGTQDPHFLEAKPSFMMKASKADLLLAVGLDLEIGWLPNILRGARNPKVATGQKGYLELGPELEPRDVLGTKATRAEGDAHALGNPHLLLDPVRAGKAASLIAERLAELDPSGAEGFRQRAKAIAARLEEKTAQWKARVEKSGVKKAISYHKTFSYFFHRFGIENPITLEPKPGVPPTSRHLIEVIRVMKAEKVTLILVENYFDASVTRKLLDEVPGARTASVAVAVEGDEQVKTLDDLYERLVKAVEGK